MADLTPSQINELFSKYGEALSEKDAHAFERPDGQSVYIPLVGDEEIWRSWDELSPDSIPEMCDYLNAVTSVKNTSAMRYVDDPMVGGETHKGRYRQAFLRKIVQGDVGRIVQVLRKGYAETIRWDEARVRTTRVLRDQPTEFIEGDGEETISPQEKYLQIFWPNCSPFKLQALAASLNDSTYTDPVVSGETRAGVWSNLVVGSEVADDGSGVITMSLAIAKYRLDGFSTWLTHRTENIAYLWGYAKDEAQAVANSWKAKGRSCTFGYSKESGLVDIILRERDYETTEVSGVTAGWNCRYKEVVDYYFGESDPKAHPLETTPANGVSYDRQLRDNGDGSYDITVITRSVQYRDAPFQTSAVTGESIVETRQQLGLTTQDAEPMETELGVIKVQRTEIRDDCSKDVITTRDRGQEQTGTTLIISKSTEIDITRKTASEDEVEEPEEATVGHIKTISNTPSKYPGRWDTEERDEVPQNQTAAGESHSEAEDAVETINTEMAVVDFEAMDKEAAEGTTRDIRAVPTEAGNVRVSDVVTTPKDIVTKETVESAAESIERTSHSENAIEPAAASETQGEINRVSSRKTPAGNYATLEEKITPKDRTVVEMVETKARSTVVTTHTESTTELAAPSQEDGKIKRRVNAKTEAGNFNTTDEEQTEHDQTATSYVKTAAEAVLVTTHTEGDGEEEPTLADGELKEAQNVPTEAGKFRSSLRVATAVDQTASSYVISAMEEEVSSLHTAGTVLSSEVLSDGTLVEIINRPTPYSNKYETIRKVSRGVYVSAAISYKDRYGTAYYATGLNATEAQYLAAVAAAALTSSTHNSINKAPSRYKNLYDFTISKRPYAPNDITTYYGTLGSYTKTLIDFEKVSVASAGNGYKWRRVELTVNDYSTNFNALNACWGILNGADSDSTMPRFLGLVAGAAAYRCVAIRRKRYSWTDGATPES